MCCVESPLDSWGYTLKRQGSSEWCLASHPGFAEDVFLWFLYFPILVNPPWLGNLLVFFFFFGLLKQIQVIILGCEYFSDNLEVSWNGATPKSSILIRIVHCKSSILGYPHLWHRPCAFGRFWKWIGTTTDFFQTEEAHVEQHPGGAEMFPGHDGVFLPERFTIEIQHVASRYDIQWIRLWEIFSGNSGNPTFWRQDYGL